jgi:cysteine synthase
MKNSILDLIGNTPIVQLQNFGPNVYAKLEGQNPGGSIKDRAAKFLIESAISRGELIKQKTIIEATSGNMGIALSMIGMAMGFKVSIVMSEVMSTERQKMLKGFGANLILTDAKTGTTGALAKARELFENNPEKYWFANQFFNPDNSRAYDIMGAEILAQIPDVSYVVGGIGTSGTMVGLSKFFQKQNSKVKTVAVIPPTGFQVQGIQNPEGDFRPGILEEEFFTEKINVNDEESFQAARDLMKKEGISAGISSGASLSAVAKLARKNNEKVLIIVPDRAEKYLSTRLFE